MKRFTPFGALVIFAMIGLLTDKFGLWFALGIVAFIVVGVAQQRRERAAGKRDPAAGDDDGITPPG